MSPETRAGTGPGGSTAIRCVLGMLGVDCHSKGLRTLARLLRDQGVEVIYAGEHNSADGLAGIVSVEDADVVGVSFSTSTYVHHTAELLAAMQRAGVGDVPVMIGGLIHPDHEEQLQSMGVAAIFGPGSTTEAIMDFLSSLQEAPVRRSARTTVAGGAHEGGMARVGCSIVIRTPARFGAERNG